MSEKTLQTRIQHKHDVEANWVKATTFKPKAGEIIIYDPDTNFTQPRFKVGDGVTNVNLLPFAISNDGNYAKLDSANTFTGTDPFIGSDATLVLDASASIPLYYKGGYNNSGIKLENNMGPCDLSGNNFNSVTYGFSNILVSRYATDNSGQVNNVGLYFPEEGGTLATQTWVNENVNIDGSNYAKLDSANTFTGTNTVTINPSDSNPF